MDQALLNRVKDALETARSANPARYFLYSNVLGEIEEAIAKQAERVSHEPPCGWEKLNDLFIQKSAYLCTHVDWDDQKVNFESLAQIIEYGKRALRECLERQPK